MNIDRLTALLAVAGFVGTFSFLLYFGLTQEHVAVPGKSLPQNTAKATNPAPPSPAVTPRKSGAAPVRNNIIDKESWSPLMLAIDAHDNRKVDALIASGADLEATTYLGSTALFVAIAVNNPDALTALLENGANVEHENKLGVRPLHFAVLRKRIESIQKIIDAGANINVVDSRYSRSPLTIAIDTLNSAITELLLANNAYADTATLKHAVKMCDADIVRSLLQHDGEKFDTASRQNVLNTTNTICRTPAQKAVIENLLLKEEM